MNCRQHRWKEFLLHAPGWDVGPLIRSVRERSAVLVVPEEKIVRNHRVLQVATVSEWTYSSLECHKLAQRRSSDTPGRVDGAVKCQHQCRQIWMRTNYLAP